MQEVDTPAQLISVIVPIYNAENYISETVHSILRQTYANWELILVNDGSTDRTKDLLDYYSGNQQIKVIHQINRGVSYARNSGAQLARGAYLCFLDADDLLTENCLQKRFDALTATRSHFMHNDIKIILADGATTNIVRSGLSGYVLDELLMWEGTVVPGPSSMVVSRQGFEEVGGFDENLSSAADQDFFIRIASKYRIERIPEVLTLYRVHPENMHKKIALMESDHIRVFRKADRNSLFRSFWFRQYCFSNLYLILAASWWGDGKNKLRALLFVVRAFLIRPRSILKIVSKLYERR